jgi:outer membrane autotransporter protein
MALGQVTSDQAATPVNASQTSVAAQNRNLSSRISALQQGVRMGLSAGGLSFHLDGETLPAGRLADGWLRQLANSGGGGAGSDSIFASGRLGVFINGNVSLGDRDRTSNQEGFDFQTNGITLGADYRFTDHLVLGAAVGYMNNNTHLDAGGGRLDADGYSLSLYGTFFQDSGLYLDGIASFGSIDYDQRRNIRYNIESVSVDQTASSDFDGDQWSASFGGGYSFSRGALAFGPTARIEYVNTDVDAYEETMSNPTADGGGWATRIESQEVDSFTLQLGGDLSYAISRSWGVLLPQVHVEWVHEFDDDAQSVVGHFLLDPSSTAFSLNTDSPDSDYVNLDLGVSAQFAHGRSAYINYRKLIGYRDLDMDSYSAGVRLEF